MQREIRGKRLALNLTGLLVAGLSLMARVGSASAEGDETQYRAPLPAKSDERLHWGAGLRFTAGSMVDLGADAVVYPWRHLGLGVTVTRGMLLAFSGCEGANPYNGNACGARWWAARPFVEARALPAGREFSPYFRAGLGPAYGDFTFYQYKPGSFALASQVEAGLEFQHYVSLRVFAAAARLDGADISGGSYGGGLQLGAAF